jgi:hypothetical protein
MRVLGCRAQQESAVTFGNKRHSGVAFGKHRQLAAQPCAGNMQLTALGKGPGHAMGGWWSAGPALAVMQVDSRNNSGPGGRDCAGRRSRGCPARRALVRELVPGRLGQEQGRGWRERCEGGNANQIWKPCKRPLAALPGKGWARCQMPACQLPSIRCHPAGPDPPARWRFHAGC